MDDELEAIILKALEKEKARRYHSAKELAEDLCRYLEGEPILARRPSSFYVLRKRLRKHRWRVALGAAAVAVSLITLVVALWWRQHDLAIGRRSALVLQGDLQRGDSSQLVGRAEALYERYRELPEVRLVWAQVQFRHEYTRSRAIRFLEDQLQRDPSRWACRALLAEICRATTGHAERAHALQARAEREATDTAEAWYLRSFATLDLPNALRFAEDAVRCEPSHVLAWQRLAHLRLETRDFDGALQGADKLIELGQEPTRWTFFKASSAEFVGEFRLG